MFLSAPKTETKSIQQSTTQKSASESESDSELEPEPELESEPESESESEPELESEQKEEHLILGHFTQTQWDEMMIQEERDTIIGEIKYDLLNKVMDGCHRVDIKRECIRYAVSWAENHLIQKVQEQFLCLDKGDDLEEICKTKDSEPEPSIPDSWAPGCLPVVYAANEKEDDIVDSPAP